MGWYNVVKPCVVGQLHYARPTAQPIDVDDEVAGPLVEDGSLTPYPAHPVPGSHLEGIKRTLRDIGGDFAEIGEHAADEGIPVELESVKPRSGARGRRRTED